MRRTPNAGRWGAAAAPLLPLLLAAALPWTRAVQLYYGLDELTDLQKVGIVDKQGTVQRHTLLSFSNNRCRAAASHKMGFPWNYMHLPGEEFELGQIMVDEPANELMEFFGAEDCGPYVFLPRGASLQAHKGGKHKLTPASQDELESWFWEFVRAPRFLLTNDGPSPVAVHWEAPGATHDERLVMTLQPGEAKAFDTFKGHTLVWREPVAPGTVGKGALLARAIVTDTAVAMGGFALSALRAGEGDSEVLQLTEEQVATWRGRLSTNLSRIRQNERQPPTVPAFTDVGFKHMKMPKELHDRLTKFHAAREAARQDEGWHRDDLHVNFYSVMTTIVHVDPATKQAVIDHVRPILDEWIGHADTLDHTSTYGIRTYYNGSVLRDHVDIGQTHIISAILNVAQDVDETWELHILDHEGRRHFVDMDAGDLVLYESAKNIHGRPFPMNGRTYRNVFTHFRPTSWANGGRPVLRPEEESDEEEGEVEYWSEEEGEEEYDSGDEFDLDEEEYDSGDEEASEWTVHEGWIEEEGSVFTQEM